MVPNPRLEAIFVDKTFANPFPLASQGAVLGLWIEGYARARRRVRFKDPNRVRLGRDGNMRDGNIYSDSSTVKDATLALTKTIHEALYWRKKFTEPASRHRPVPSGQQAERGHEYGRITASVSPVIYAVARLEARKMIAAWKSLGSPHRPHGILCEMDSKSAESAFVRTSTFMLVAMYLAAISERSFWETGRIEMLPRSNGIYSDAVLRPFIRERLGQHGNPALAHRVPSHADASLERRQTRDVDDSTRGPIFDPSFSDLSANCKRRIHVDLHHFVVQFVCILCCIRAALDPCGIDEDLELVRGDDLGDDFGYG